MPSSRDKWAEWVLDRSHAADAGQKRRSMEFLGPVRDRVLENAPIQSGDVVVDVEPSRTAPNAISPSPDVARGSATRDDWLTSLPASSFDVMRDIRGITRAFLRPGHGG